MKDCIFFYLEYLDCFEYSITQYVIPDIRIVLSDISRLCLKILKNALSKI